jgi:transcriptional regulator with XRE-family HTH domain
MSNRGRISKKTGEKSRNYEFGKLLYRYRKMTGLNQKEMAKLIGVSLRQFSSWESAEYCPTDANLKKLCQVLLRQRAFIVGRDKRQQYANFWVVAGKGAVLDELWLDALLEEQKTTRLERFSLDSVNSGEAEKNASEGDPVIESTPIYNETEFEISTDAATVTNTNETPQKEPVSALALRPPPITSITTYDQVYQEWTEEELILVLIRIINTTLQQSWSRRWLTKLQNNEHGIREKLGITSLSFFSLVSATVWFTFNIVFPSPTFYVRTELVAGHELRLATTTAQAGVNETLHAKVGDVVTATYTITNVGEKPITVRPLVWARFGEDWSGEVKDFPLADEIVLAPHQQYVVVNKESFSKVGKYFVEPGQWVDWRPSGFCCSRVYIEVTD